MATGSLELTHDGQTRWRLAAAGLLLAAIVVGVAIVVGGMPARALNGIGALVWVGSGVWLAWTVPAPQRRAIGWIAAVAGGVVLGALVRPATVPEAALWFFLAGVVVTLAAGDRTGAWALLVPAIYLPVHLLIGIGRAMLRNGGVRTEPPPTAAVLPLVMILAVALAGALAAWFVRRGQEG